MLARSMSRSSPAIAIALLVMHVGLWTSWSGDLLMGRTWIMMGCLFSLLTGTLAAATDLRQSEKSSLLSRRLWSTFLTLLDLLFVASVFMCVLDALDHRNLLIEPSIPRAATVATSRFLLGRHLRINSLLERRWS